MTTDRDISQESQACREFEAEMRAHAQSIGKRLEEVRAATKNFAYIAGLFDGEVTFSITPHSPNSYSLGLRWNKSDYPILSFVKGFLGGSVRKVKPQPFYRFDVWEWHVCGGNAYRAIRKVYPFLRVKKEDATICLAFWDRYSVGYEKGKRASHVQQAIGALYMSQLQGHHLKPGSSKGSLSLKKSKQPLSAPAVQEYIQAPILLRNRRLPNIGLPELELAYIAGLLDVESSFLIYKMSGRPSYLLEVNDRKKNCNSLQYLAGIFGGNMRPALSTSNKRDAWLWKLCSARAYILLRLIYPFLRVKRRAAEICIEFFELYWQGKSSKPVSPERQAIGVKYAALLREYQKKSMPHRRRE